MKLSYFMQPVHPKDKDYGTALAEDMEAIELADRLGFAEAWVGEHHASSVEPITSPLIFMANLIQRTKQIKFATGVLCMPQYHPAQVAGHTAMFDHLAKGRFVMGVGPGGLPPDFELFDVMEKDRGEMMVEAIDIIHKIWASDPPYAIDGKYWSVNIKDWTHDDLGFGRMRKPYQKPYPPVAVSAMSPYSGMMRLAAVRDFEPISANFIGTWSVKSHWETYLDECAKQGKDPVPSRWRVARSIFVADSDAEAEEIVMKPGGAFDSYYDYLFTIFDRAEMKPAFVTERGNDPEKLTHRELVDKLVIRGTAKSVAEQLLAFREDVGPFEHLLMTAHDWDDKARMRRSMELMATEVIPEISRATGTATAEAAE